MSERKGWGGQLLIGLAVSIVLMIGLALFGDYAFSSVAITTALQWGIAGTLFFFILLWLMGRFGQATGSLEEMAQGAAAAVTVIALFIAAGIYFLERKDRLRVQFDLSAARALLPAQGPRGSGANPGLRTVLLGIRVLITNNSARQLEMKCISLGLFLPAHAAGTVRSQVTPEEMAVEPIVEPIPYDRDDGNPDHAEDLSRMRECLAAEQARAGVRPLFMWRPLRLEPSDADDLYFEFPVSCRYSFVRVLVKMRINPTDRDVYETKAIIPLDDVCEGRGNGMARSVTPEGISGAGDAPSAESPAGATR